MTPARQRLHANAADAELPVPAGLFLVPALHVGAPANRFAVGNLGRFQRDIHPIPFLEAADSDLDRKSVV